MWETTFARNSHAGLGRPFYERNILTSMKSFRKAPTQSGVAISEINMIISNVANKKSRNLAPTTERKSWHT